jgi:hypothetical protein
MWSAGGRWSLSRAAGVGRSTRRFLRVLEGDDESGAVREGEA